MKKSWKYLLFFLLCLAIALVVNLPLRQVLPYIKLPNTVRLAGVSGTVVHGKAREINVNQFPLRDVSYRFKPSCIALLKLCYQVDYAQGVTEVGYDLLNGDTEVSQARVEYPATQLAGFFPNMIVQPEGRLELIVDDMAIVAGKPAAMSGKLIWRDLGMQSDEATLNIGDYQVDFSGNQQQYDFKLSDLDASLEVDGKGDVSSDGQYRVDIKISSATTIDSRVKNVLDLFATTVSYNNYRLEKTGLLPPNITRQLFQ